jgi:serine/threonine-protein kinase
VAQRLERHLDVALAVEGAIHNAHAAGTEAPAELEPIRAAKFDVIRRRQSGQTIARERYVALPIAPKREAKACRAARAYDRRMGEPTDIDVAETLGPDRRDAVRLVDSLASGGERYHDEGTLGRGGMGIVSLRLDRKIGRRVAAKELRPELAADEASRARFLREAQVQGQLEHPAVPPLYDLGERANGSLYFTMKTLRGVTLRDILERLAAGDELTARKYTPHRLLAGFASVCLAVDYAHQRGILHRDIKPANIMFGDFGEVYLLDWGLAKIQGESDAGVARDPEKPTPEAMTHVGSVMGTPGYMAPEQMEDARAVGTAADVYSLGAVLFELLTLEPLHTRSSVREVMQSTREGADARASARAPDREIPPELDAACVEATATEPSERCPSARAVHDAVQSYLEGERDLELRRARSAEHTRAAIAAAEQARAGGDGALASRRRTMQELGRALALDPDNADAVSVMAGLFANPPDQTPPEVEFAIERGYRRSTRWVGRMGVIAYAGVLGFLPLLFWMGIRQPGVVVAFFALLGVCVALSARVMSSKSPPTPLILAAMVFSSAAFALCARFGSPLLLMPTALAVNAAGYAIFLHRRYRWWITGVATTALLAMVGLEVAGVLAPTFGFSNGRLEVLPVALSLPPVATTVLVVFASVVAMVLCTLLVGHIRDQLADAERRIYLYAWHLRELVPPDAREMTDPAA